MIHRVYANHDSFRPISLTKGLNIIVADRTSDSSSKDTRNGVGKSTLLDIIHFCLGADMAKSRLNCDALKGWAFTLDISLGDNRLLVTRAVGSNSVIVDGRTDGFIIQPTVDSESNALSYSNDNWVLVLGSFLFSLDLPGQNRPSFRTLISYFIRPRSGYADPIKFLDAQRAWSKQVNVAYLLGMNWKFASDAAQLASKLKNLMLLQKEMQSSTTSVGDLESQVVSLEKQIEEAYSDIDRFRIHPNYEELERRASQLTNEIHQQINAKSILSRQLARYRQSLKKEVVSSPEEIRNIYQAANVSLSEAVVRTFEEVKQFHERIIRNRSEFLKAEIARLKADIDNLSTSISDLNNQRVPLLQILQEKGALQEMVSLQERYGQLQTKLSMTQERLQSATMLKSTMSDIKSKQTQNLSMAIAEHQALRVNWSQAIRLYNDHANSMYGQPGKLIIDLSTTGYRFDTVISRDDSTGLSKMKIFIFDLVLLQMQSFLNRKQDFLIHDSLMFDGVDARQCATAIEMADKIASQLNGQYICVLNSDAVPIDDFSSGFNFEHFVRAKLTDKEPEGTLLGIRYERKSAQTDSSSLDTFTSDEESLDED